MTGVVTKKHIILIVREFGWRKALRVLIRIVNVDRNFVTASSSPIAMVLPFYYPTLIASFTDGNSYQLPVSKP